LLDSVVFVFELILQSSHLLLCELFNVQLLTLTNYRFIQRFIELFIIHLQHFLSLFKLFPQHLILLHHLFNFLLLHPQLFLSHPHSRILHLTSLVPPHLKLLLQLPNLNPQLLHFCKLQTQTLKLMLLVFKFLRLFLQLCP
jgi:hypothetical protein